MAWIIHTTRSKTRFRLPFLLTCILFLTTAGWWPAFAAAADPENPDSELGGFGSEELYFGDLPIVLSATRLSQPISEAPVAVTVIDRELIEATGARELADIFRLVPGFVVGSKDGSQRIVGYHGILDAFNRRMQVLIDGRSVYTPTFGGVLWSDLPLSIEDIDRIEVVRGPNAATYGPNSFQGVISITTRHASEDSGNKVKISTGSHGIADAYYRTGGSAGDFDYRVSLKANADSGFENLHDDKLLKALDFRGDYQATPRDSFEFHAGFSDGVQQTQDSGVLRDKDVSSYSLQALWRHFVRLGNEIRLQIYYNNFETIDNYYDSINLGGGITYSGTVDLDRVGKRTDIELQQLLSITPDLNIVWGTELRRDEVISAGFFGLDESRTNDLLRVFGSIDYEVFEKTNLSFGVMVEDNDISDRTTSPRLAINHELTNGHTVRASLSRATRTPSFFESMVSWAVIGDLNPPVPAAQGALFLYQAPDTLNEEKIESIDLGYFFNLPYLNLSGDVRLYREHYRDLIVDSHYPFTSLPNPYLGVPNLNVLAGEDVPSVANAIDVILRGVEFQMDWRPSKRDRLFVGYAVVDADVSDPSHDMVNSIPEEIFSVIWSHDFDNDFRTSFSFYSIDEFEYLGTSDGNRIEEQRRLDLKFSQGFKSLNTRGEISFVVQSAFGSYEDYEPVNVFDTRAFISLALEF